MPFDIEFIRSTLKAEGIHLENDGPLDSFYNFAVAIREQTIKELQGGPRADIVDELVEALKYVMTAHGEQLSDAFEKAQNVLAKLEEE